MSPDGGASNAAHSPNSSGVPGSRDKGLSIPSRSGRPGSSCSEV